MKPTLIETEEMAAIRYVANGDGSHKIPKGNPLYGTYDEVYVAIFLEDPTKVHIYLRKEGGTLRQFVYELKRITEEGEESDGG